MRSPDNVVNRSEVRASFRQDWIAHIDVVAQHVRGSIKPVVHHAIMDHDFVPPNLGFDPAQEMKIFSKNGRLLDQAFAEKNTIVSFPAFPVSEKTTGNGANPTVDRAIDRFPMNVMVVFCGVRMPEQNMI